jgi:AraC-like DNA-binding protein
MPEDHLDKRRISLGHMQDSGSPPLAVDHAWRRGGMGGAMPLEWRFGGMRLRRGAIMACAGQASPSRDAIRVVLALKDGRGCGPMRLSIHLGESLDAGPAPLRHDVLALEIADGAGGIPGRARNAAPDTAPDAPSFCAMIEIDAARGPGALLAHHMLQLSEQIAQVPQDRLETLALATRALVEMCMARPAIRSCAPAGCASSAGPNSGPNSGLIERARLGVRRNMASVEFGPAELARLLAMSRSKLYRLLLPEGGVAHFINRERLLQAQRELAADETASIHAIAARVGYKDHSTFSRAFRRAFGATPSQARANGPIRLQGGEAQPPAMRSDEGWMTDAGMLARSRPENGMISPDLGFWADTGRRQCW